MEREQAAAQAASREKFNATQRTVVEEVLTSKDRIHGLQGLAGTGKTTALEVIREGAEKGGYAVEGFAPTSRAAGQLRDAGISATTLQSFLARGQSQSSSDPNNKHLYMLDESSLASTTQMRAFLEKIGSQDRVLVIGDVRQHQGVDAGRPFEQMQDAGMRTSQLDQIVRQRNNPELLQAVQLLATGKTAEGVKMLAEQGRVTEVKDASERVAEIAKDYAAQPDRTIIVSPDNRSRQLINQAVRTELQAKELVATDDQQFRTLVHRSDMTGPDREWAARYQAGDVLKYTKGSKVLGIEKDSSAKVVSTNPRENTLIVEREDGTTITYDPKRLKGVNAYQETARDFATGDRIQFTVKDKDLNVSNRDLGTITKLETGQITVRMDGKEERTLSFDPAKMKIFDFSDRPLEVRWKGYSLPYRVFSKDQRVSHTAVVENKRLGHALAVVKEQQDVKHQPKIRTNSEKLGYQKRGRQLYGPDYKAKIVAPPAVEMTV
jgi:ATP-dependent exoDNAse (exonuclease V) alpha subunit